MGVDHAKASGREEYVWGNAQEQGHGSAKRPFSPSSGAGSELDLGNVDRLSGKSPFDNGSEPEGEAGFSGMRSHTGRFARMRGVARTPAAPAALSSDTTGITMV